MALVNCPECGHQVSESAQSCPSCGHPLADVRAIVSESQTPGSATYPAGTALIFTIVGAAAIVVGSLLPWISVRTVFGTISASGTEGDGVITLIAGAAIGALGGVALSKKSASRTTGILIILLGVAVGLIAFNVFSNVASAADLTGGGVFTTVGSGLWLVILGGGTAIGSGFSVFSSVGVGVQPRSAWAGVGVGVAVVVVLLIALAMASQWASDSVDETFQDIADALNSP